MSRSKGSKQRQGLNAAGHIRARVPEEDKIIECSGAKLISIPSVHHDFSDIRLLFLIVTPSLADTPCDLFSQVWGQPTLAACVWRPETLGSYASGPPSLQDYDSSVREAA